MGLIVKHFLQNIKIKKQKQPTYVAIGNIYICGKLITEKRIVENASGQSNSPSYTIIRRWEWLRHITVNVPMATYAVVLKRYHEFIKSTSFFLVFALVPNQIQSFFLSIASNRISS